MDLLHSPNTLGLMAGALTTIAFLPQLVKTWRSQSAEDVSIGMFLLFGAGVLLWGVYGWEIHAIPVIVTNVVTFVLASAILALKLLYDRRAQQAESTDDTESSDASSFNTTTSASDSSTDISLEAIQAVSTEARS